MEVSNAKILSSSFRAGMSMETKLVYNLFTRRSFGSEIKLNIVTAKRRIIKKNVAYITMTTFISQFRFVVILYYRNAAGKRSLFHQNFYRRMPHLSDIQ
jgi:hypothetical protein